MTCTVLFCAVLCSLSYEGRLLVAGAGRVDWLAPTPWQQRAAALLQAGQPEAAVQLAAGTGRAGPVLQKAGFLHLAAGRYTEAEQRLLEGEVDCREVLSLVPGLLPASPPFLRADPPLHDIPVLQGEPALQFVLSYLQAVARQGGEEVQLVHTAIAKLLSQLQPDKLPAFLQGDPAPTLDYEELGESWRAAGHAHWPALLDWMAGRQEAAVVAWAAQLSHAHQDQDPQFPGLQFYVRQLTSCPEKLVLQYCEPALAQDEMMGARLFCRAGATQQLVERGLELLAGRYPAARLAVLEWLVLEQGSQQEEHHTQLVLAHLAALKQMPASSPAPPGLSKLILTSPHLNAAFLLQQLQQTELHYETAVLHGRLGEHATALNILVRRVGRPELAEQYCDQVRAAVPNE